MRRYYGFNLLSLLVSIALGSIIVISVSKMYATIAKSKLYVTTKQLSTLINATVINQLNMDIMQSGNFGCFNTRKLVSNGYGEIHTFDQTRFLSYDYLVAGMYAFSSANIPKVDNKVFANINLQSNSDILKLQYGRGVGNIIKSSSENNQLTNLSFVSPYYTKINSQDNAIMPYKSNQYRQPVDISSNDNAPYVIASCRRLDQILSRVYNDDQSNTVFIGDYNIPIQGSLSHDKTWIVMNFVTRYYYVANINNILGLYATTSDKDGNIGNPVLLASNVDKVDYNFIISSSPSATIKSTNNMIYPNDWQNISTVVFNLSLESSTFSSSARQVISQSVKVIK